MKPVVLYNRDDGYDIEVGMHARICPVNHSSNLVTNDVVVTTSAVLSEDSGVFETINTIYVPIKRDVAKAYHRIDNNQAEQCYHGFPPITFPMETA